jgi:hypothetical protein
VGTVHHPGKAFIEILPESPSHYLTGSLKKGNSTTINKQNEDLTTQTSQSVIRQKV